MSVIDIPQTTQELQQGGCWWPTFKDDILVMLMRCPECNQFIELTGYTLAKGGYVTPSVNCMRCEFDCFVRLLKD